MDRGIDHPKNNSDRATRLPIKPAVVLQGQTSPVPEMALSRGSEFESWRQSLSGNDGESEGRFAHEETSNSIVAHYTISEDRSGNEESVKSSILSRLGERETKRNLDLSLLVRH